MKRKAVFLDRDGTIIVDRHYTQAPEQVELLPQVVEGLSQMQELGYELFVVSNQSGVARGLITMREVEQVNLRMLELLIQSGIIIQAIRICPHYPDGSISRYSIACSCRKPEPGMLLQLASDYRLDLEQSIMVGDKETDCEAGHAAGCQSICLSQETVSSSFVGLPDLLAVANWLQRNQSNS